MKKYLLHAILLLNVASVTYSSDTIKQLQDKYKKPVRQAMIHMQKYLTPEFIDEVSTTIQSVTNEKDKRFLQMGAKILVPMSFILNHYGKTVISKLQTELEGFHTEYDNAQNILSFLHSDDFVANIIKGLIPTDVQDPLQKYHDILTANHETIAQDFKDAAHVLSTVAADLTTFTAHANTIEKSIEKATGEEIDVTTFNQAVELVANFFAKDYTEIVATMHKSSNEIVQKVANILAAFETFVNHHSDGMYTILNNVKTKIQTFETSYNPIFAQIKRQVEDLGFLARFGLGSRYDKIISLTNYVPSQLTVLLHLINEAQTKLKPIFDAINGLNTSDEKIEE